MSKRLAPSLLGLVLLGAASYAGVAVAEPSAKDRALAKGDWTHGKQLMAVKNYDEAVEAFKKAIGRDPKAQYKLDLGRALAETGKLVEAEKLYEEVQKTEEANAEKERAAARSLSNGLVPRIPTLKIVVSGPDEDAVKATIDGEAAKIGVEIREDPGSYEIEATADKYEPVKKKASVAEGEKFEVALKFTRTAGSSGGDEATSSHGGNMIPAGIAFGVGGTGIVLGTVFGILAFTTTNDLSAVCKGNLCPPSAASDIDTTKLYGDVSTGTFVVGGVGITLGIILAVTVGKGSSAKGDDKKPEKAFVVPYAWPGGAGLAGRF